MVAKSAKKKQLKEDKIQEYISGVSRYDGIFGLPFDFEESELILLPVPWDITNFNDGSADAPEAILEASKSIGIHIPEYEDIWQKGIFMQNIPIKWKESSYEIKKILNRVRKQWDKKLSDTKKQELLKDCRNINFTSRLLNEWVETKTLEFIKLHKTVGLLGGDQSIRSGFLNSLSKKYSSFGILHLDAHADLKASVTGLDYTDFSSIYHSMKIEKAERIVFVGLRDVSIQENEILKKEMIRTRVFTDRYLKDRLFKGTTWKMVVNEIISVLPKNIYISFDTDVLQLWLSPNNGFPEPGGLTYHEITSLLNELANSGKKIIGFDFCGIRPTETNNNWDSKVGSRLLYELCCSTLKSGRK